VAIERVFVDSDTQFDFIDPAGRLYVPGADEIHEAIGRLIRYAREMRIPVLSPVDEHPEDDPEFEQFGPHCVRGTAGQEKLGFTRLEPSLTLREEDELPDRPSRLVAEYAQLIFPKRVFSVFSSPSFEKVIDGLDVGEYVVFGVALDYCVREVSLGLLARGQRVTIVRDAVRSITPEGEKDTTRLLTERGARWVDALEVTIARSSPPASPNPHGTRST